jgi:hypothetical protein
MTSPASTGGSGPLFEAQVGAAYLLSMLLEVDARGLPNCRIDSIALQRGQEGYPLDDVIVHGQDRSGKAATLEIQVKRSITFTPADEVFRDVVKQVKKAMGNPTFWESHHQLAVAIARTTQKIESAYQDVLNWARNIENATTFHARLNREGEANDAMRSFVATFRDNLRAAGAPRDDETVWKLLRRFHILAFDFSATDSASAELMHERALRALESGGMDEARNLWSRLTTLSLEIAVNAGHRTRESLRADLSTFQLAGDRNNRKALAAIAEESQLALSDINAEVSGVRLLRQRRVDAVRDAMSLGRYIEIRGEAGVGKSGVLRRLAEDLSAEAHVLVLSPNRVIERGWLSMKSAIGYDGSGRDLMNDLSLCGAAIVFIDNLDFFADAEQTTVRDIVRFAAEAPNIWVVATARVEFAKTEPNWLPNDVLTSLGQTEPVLIKELDDAEVSELKERAHRLSQLLSDSHPARAIVRNLFRLSRLANRPDNEPWPATEAEMAKQWWDLADGKNDTGLRDRSRLLRRLTEHSLSSTQPYNAETEDAQALNTLVASGTLRDYGNDRVTFRHDVLREWAIANLVFGERGFGSRFQLAERATPDLARGAELAARMALEQSDGLERWPEILAQLGEAHETWRRAVLLALVRSELSIKILVMASAALLENDAALFSDLARYVLAVEFEFAVDRMRARGHQPEGIPPTWEVPRNSSCAHLVAWLLLISDSLPPAALPDAVKVYSSYLTGTLGNDAFAPRILCYLHQWLQTIEVDRESNPYGLVNRVFGGNIPENELKVMEEELRTAFLSFCNHTPELAASYLQSFVGRQHADETKLGILKFRGALAQAAPKELADFTIDTLVGNGERERRRSRHSGPFPEEPFEFIDLKFLPASPSQGPFLDLLLHCPEEGLRLVRRIVTYAVQFYRGGKRDNHATVVYFNEDGIVFPWPEFYYWSRDNGNAPSLVTSALMALEAWAHKRVEGGDPTDSVLAQIVGDPAMSNAALLVAVDIVLSHWPQSSEAALPLVACPELLCMDRLRPSHDNMKFPDLFGLKELQHEPLGPATLESLKGRISRKVSLYDLLCRLPFGPADVNDKVRALLLRAVSRLGPPDKDSDLGDPRMMALHALNLLDRQNWKEVTVTNAEGQAQTLLQYKAPEAESKHLDPIRQDAIARLEENGLQLALPNALLAAQTPGPEFLEKGVAWALRHQDIFDHRPEFDWNGEYLATVEAVVCAATLLARDGTPEQLAQYGSWMRGIFARAHEGESDQVYLQREGLRFNPRAIAFVGQTLLIERDPKENDVRRLLEFASANGYASAHGFIGALFKLGQINALLLPAILRCAFTASVYPYEPWRISTEQKESNRSAYQERIWKQIDLELAWLTEANSEPAWPEFPLQKIRPRNHWRRGKRDYAAEAAEYDSVKLRVNYHRAALWLKQIRPFDPGKQLWLRALLSAYAEWTRQANGFGEEKEDQYDGQPDGWNEVYFDLAAKCASGLSEDALEQSLQDLFGGLPDESFCGSLPLFLKSADQAFFEKNSLSIERLLQIRTFLIKQLYGTRVFGWNKDREEASVEMHLGGALATICFNDHNGPFPSKCYLPASFIPRTDPFLPLLEEFVGKCRSPFLAVMYLNFMEVAPRAEQLPFVVGCTEKWLERFPENNQFWIEWDFGRRLSSVFITIFRASPVAFGANDLRGRVDRILGQFVGLGVAQAHEMETMLYQSNQ